MFIPPYPESHNANPHSTPGFVAFDLEIAKIVPGDFGMWRMHRPLGISCAAMLFDDCDSGQAPKLELWCSQEEQGDGKYAPQMSRADAARLVGRLEEAAARGWQIVTWNGLGFDFDILAEESGCRGACRELALGHIDMMFHFFCLQGYTLGLDKAAKGMGLVGKTAGMRADLAPQYWREGRQTEVLEYVAQDVRTALDLAKRCGAVRRVAWTSRAGRPQQASLPQGWLSVRQAMRLPLPDTSWMVSPMKREEFLAWTLTTDI